MSQKASNLSIENHEAENLDLQVDDITVNLNASSLSDTLTDSIPEIPPPTLPKYTHAKESSTESDITKNKEHENDPQHVLLHCIQKAESESTLFQMRFSTILCTGLPGGGKTSFCNLLMNKDMESGDFHTVFIKKKSENDWTEIDFAQLKKLIDELNDYKQQSVNDTDITGCGIMNSDNLWDVLVLMDIGIPPSALHFLQPSVVTFFTYRMMGRDNLCPLSCRHIKELLSSVSFERETRFKELEISDKSKKNKKAYYTAFIGTHDGRKSQQEHYNKEADKLDETLRLIHDQIHCSNQELTFSVWYKNRSKTCGDQLVHVININDKQDENIYTLKKNINDVIYKKTAHRLPFTWVWLYFRIKNLCFERNKFFVFYKEVHEIWKLECCGSEKELKLTLQFFHYCGVLFYFDSLHEYVFIDCRWLFNCLNYLTSEYVEDSHLDYGAKETWKQEGLLKSSMINEIKFEVAPGEIELDSFINLLADLKYIAPVNENYFFPHILEYHEVNVLDMYGASHVDPLFITFSPGLLHPSMFCHLVAHILNTMPKKWPRLRFHRQTKHTYKDLITFSLDPHSYICFINEIFHLKIQICNKPEHRNFDTSLPNSVFKIILKALEEVCKKLCLSFNTIKYGFLCSDCGNESEQHMMIVNHVEGQAAAVCCKTYNLLSLSDSCHTAWFSKVSLDAHPPSQATDAEDTQDGNVAKFTKETSQMIIPRQIEQLITGKQKFRELINPDGNVAKFTKETSQMIIPRQTEQLITGKQKFREPINPDENPTLKKLQTFGVITDVCERWYELGIQLLDDKQVVRLRSIKTDNDNDKTRCREMLTFWLQTHPKATWYDLVEALRSRAVQINNVAKDLEDRFNAYSIPVEAYMDNQRRRVSSASHPIPEQMSLPVLYMVYQGTGLPTPSGIVSPGWNLKPNQQD